MTLEQGIKKISDFCVRRKERIKFDPDGWIRRQISHGTNYPYTSEEFANIINDDDQRVCHKELVTWMRSELTIEDGNALDERLKASEASLAQTTEPNG